MYNERTARSFILLKHLSFNQNIEIRILALSEKNQKLNGLNQDCKRIGTATGEHM